MKQQLTQRLIGAVVVTALAAIFIPMLFDDPVEDSSQAVSELSIPKEPVVAIDGTADKLPENANEVLQATDTESEKSGKEQDVLSEPLENEELSDAQPVQPDDESELEQSKQNTAPEVIESNAVSEEEEFGQANNDDVNDSPAPAESPEESLDTGVVKEANKPAAMPEKSLPSQTEAVTKPKKTVKKPDTHAPKQALPAKSLADTSVKPADKPLKSSSELSRWYIQAGSFNKKENALSLLENLRKQGLPASLETIKTAEKGPLYRIKVGPELDKKRAAAMKAKLDKQNINNILIAE